VRVDQFVPSLVKHDAIGNHVLQIRRVLRDSGIDGDIFHDIVDRRLANQGRPYVECDPRPSPDRLILYHASTQSRMVPWLQQTAANGQAVAVDYHNITPAEYFWRWDPAAAEQLVEARQELATLSVSAALAMADSRYNESELQKLGYHSTAVAPLLVDLDQYHATPDRVAAKALAGRRTRGGRLWLFVGRLAPNKCQHDVIAAFAMYRRRFDRGARLALVGSPTPFKYRQALQRMSNELEVSDAVEFHASVSLPRLLAYYRAADVFVCLSEHEGFCVPVLEAMELGVPVVAFDAAAVTDTVGSGGVLIKNKDPVYVAQIVHRLVSDADSRSSMVERGRARARDFALESTSRQFLAALGGWHSEGLRLPSR
jgi:glycosyltransferase involved in cell wall biosynthesis